MAVAKAAQAAMRREWCETRPEDLGDAARPRFKRLYNLLRSGKLDVRVLPDEVFGLIHGKAGVITGADGRQTSFLGSANESGTAFRLNYELIWEDDSADAVAWVQQEFDALWSSPFAVPLAEFVIRDLDRLSRRELIGAVTSWREAPDPASAVVESPVYRREVGLWEHQKHFVKPAFNAHRGPHGARFVLADQVGLGKTLQLAMAAQLMALIGDRPVLVLAPRTLVWQWQDEIDTLLGLPSAVWTGGQWVDEHGVEHPGAGPESIRRCPRRAGIVQSGCIVFSQYFDSVQWLADQLTGNLRDEPIGVYAGANRSGTMRNGAFAGCGREVLKDAVRRGELRLLLGTNAASEGLNLQQLGSLVNLDLPWNPSRLEQRKGRIQRIGQVRSEVDVYNMRYANSVEDRVRQLLSERQENIFKLFGQLPDTLEDVWVQVALGQLDEAKRTIDAVPDRHPFALRYHEVERVDWETCARVLGDDAKRKALARGWNGKHHRALRRSTSPDGRG